ncbi:MAG: hypothetical protein WKG01_28525 [Kofleriaceae bacterium]
MDATRVSSERQVETEQQAGSAVEQGADTGAALVRQIVRTYGADPAGIATGLNASGRTNDHDVWIALQRSVGNAVTLQVRQLVEGNGAVVEGGVASEIGAPPPTASPAHEAAGATAVGVEQAAIPPAPRERVVHGVRIVSSPGVRPDAVDACATFITQLVGDNEHAQQKFQNQRVAIVIIPAATRMTDLPQFARLRGQQTFDGRTWDEVRGSGGMRAPDGSWVVGVSEENLVEVKTAIGGTYGEFGLGMHEMAHTLQTMGLTRKQQSRLDRLYSDHRQRDPANAARTWTDNYAAENTQEYFAQSTNCFFGTNSLPGNANGRDWLAANDRPMFDFLVELYERNIDRRGRVREQGHEEAA